MTARKRTAEPRVGVGGQNNNTGQSLDKRYATQRRYTDEQKIAGVIAMRTIGIGTSEGLEAARKAVGDEVAASSLYAWSIEFNDRVNALTPVEPPLSDSVIADGVRNQIISDMQSALGNIAHEIKDKDRLSKEQNIQRLVTAAAILIDKLQKIAGITPEMEQAIRVFSYECDMRKENPIDTLNDYTEMLRQGRMNQLPTTGNR